MHAIGLLGSISWLNHRKFCCHELADLDRPDDKIVFKCLIQIIIKI
jgi:hypothetical protein